MNSQDSLVCNRGKSLFLSLFSFIPSVWFSECVSPLQVTPGPSLHHSVPCGSTWMFFFPPPLSCTCALSPWTVMWPSGTPSDTIDQTHAHGPGPKSRRSGPSLQVQHVGMTLCCSVMWSHEAVMNRMSFCLMSHGSDLMYVHDNIVLTSDPAFRISLLGKEKCLYWFEMTMAV